MLICELRKQLPCVYVFRFLVTGYSWRVVCTVYTLAAYIVSWAPAEIFPEGGKITDTDTGAHVLYHNRMTVLRTYTYVCYVQDGFDGHLQAVLRILVVIFLIDL